MLGWLKRRPGAGVRAAPAEVPPLAPDRVAYAVGDIHGRVDLLERLLDLIEAETRRDGRSEAQLVFLGDYVDRGEQSSEVLQRLMALSRAEPDRVTCLMGNHEQMMLDFIDQGESSANGWMRVGGLQTLASFGIGGVSETAPPEAMSEAAQRLADAAGPDLLGWLRERPLMTRNGNVCFVHAATDPARDLADQPERMLLWGGAGPEVVPRSDGQWVVHGHFIVDEPFAAMGHVNVDTGAWFTGRLTAARLAGGDVGFLST